MTDSLDEFARRLQEEIFAESRKIYGEKAFGRWQNPKYMGRMAEASTVGRIKGSCGDTMEIYLRIENERIVEASFYTDGCASSMACGSVAVELALGKDLDEAAAIEADTILSLLQGLPQEEHHCALLAAETLHTAIHNWIIGIRHREPGEPASRPGPANRGTGHGD